SIFGGPFNWRVGFVSCFAGIWLGDLGLYSLARCAGKNLLDTRWVRRFADPCAISRCEKVFSRHSSVALITSRFVPGTRLPTYLAAGLFGFSTLPSRSTIFSSQYATAVSRFPLQPIRECRMVDLSANQSRKYSSYCKRQTLNLSPMLTCSKDVRRVTDCLRCIGCAAI